MLTEEQKETATHFYARLLGVSDADATPKVLRLVRELLFDVPEGWEVQVGEEGEAKNFPYFHNSRSNESQWEHPLQHLHQRRVDDMLQGTAGSPGKRRSGDSGRSGSNASRVGGGARQSQRRQLNAPAHDVLDMEDWEEDDEGGSGLGSSGDGWKSVSAVSRETSKEPAASSGSRKSVRWEDLSSTGQQLSPVRAAAPSSFSPVNRFVAPESPRSANDSDKTIANLKLQLQRAEAALEAEQKLRSAAETGKATEVLVAKQQADKAFEAQLKQLKDAHLKQLQTMEERQVSLANELQEARLEIVRNPKAEELNTDLRRVKQEAAEAAVVQRELQTRIDQQLQEISDLHNQNSELTARVSLLLEQQAENASKTRDATSSDNQAALEAALLQATQQIKLLEAEAAKSKNQVILLEAELRNARASRENEQHQRQLDDGTIQQLKQKLAALTSENEAKLAQLQSRVSEMEGNAFVLEQQLQQETSAHITAQREQANRINVLTLENHRLSEQLKSTEGQLELTRQRVRDLQSELIRSQDAHQRLQETHKHIAEDHRTEQQKYQQTTAQLQLDLQAAREKIAKQQEAMSKMSSDYADQVAALEKEISLKIPEMAQKAILRAESNWSEKTRIHLAKLHQEYDRQCEAYRAQIKRLQETIEHIEFQLRQVRSDSERSISNYRDRCTALQARVRDLEDQLAHSRVPPPATPASAGYDFRSTFTTPHPRQGQVSGDNTAETTALHLHLALLQKQCSMILDQQQTEQQGAATRSFIAGSQLNAHTPKAEVEDVSFALGGYSTPARTPFRASNPAPVPSTSKRLPSSAQEDESSQLQLDPVVGSSSTWSHDSIGFTRGYWRHKYSPHVPSRTS